MHGREAMLWFRRRQPAVECGVTLLSFAAHELLKRPVEANKNLRFFANYSDGAPCIIGYRLLPGARINTWVLYDAKSSALDALLSADGASKFMWETEDHDYSYRTWARIPEPLTACLWQKRVHTTGAPPPCANNPSSELDRAAIKRLVEHEPSH